MTFTPIEDCLFTATSATCVTGLVIYDTYSHWSLFGQSVILGLIQIGGLGLVTITTFFNIALGKKLGFRGLQLAQESMSATSLIDVTRLIKMVIALSLAVEGVGALLLATRFVPAYGQDGIFLSVFLAVSAFCNAGFDLLGRQSPFASLTNYNGDPVVLYTIMALIIIGGLGFVVIHDLYNHRQTKKLMLHTKIVLMITAALILFGALLIGMLEWNNPETMGGLSMGEKINASVFQSVTARTAGFNSVDIQPMYSLTKVITILLMFIGAAPGGTGGGIKVTTVAVIAIMVISVIRGREEAVMFSRKIPQRTINKSIAVVALAALAVSIASLTLYGTGGMEMAPVPGIDAVFESVSAFATVGLTAGVTDVASLAGKLVLTLTMFIGRVGPVSFALSLAARGMRSRKEVVPEAKILVG